MAPLTANQIKTAYAEAMKLHASKDSNAAIARLNKLAAECPRLPEPPYQIGRILIERFQATAAMPYLARAAEIKPAEPAIWNAWAEAAALGAGPDEERSFLEALKKAPIPVQAKLTLQNRFGPYRKASKPAAGGAPAPELQRMIAGLSRGEAPRVELMAGRVLARHPKSAIAASILATAQTMLGKHAAAHENYLRAIKIDPNYAEAHEHLGRMLFDLNRKEEAVRHFSRALTLAPGLQSALINLGSALTMLGSPAASLPLLTRALAEQPDLEVIHRGLGNAHTRLRNYAQAESALLRALELTDTPEARTIALLAQAQARLGKEDEAAANFERALAMDPDEPLAVVGKAVQLQTLGQFDEAQVLFRRGFELDPLNGDNYRQFMSSYKAEPGDPLIGEMKKRHQDVRMDDTNRMNMGYALAKALEDVKEDDGVFRYLDEANALMKKSYAYDISLRLREVASTKLAMKDVDWHNVKIGGASDCAPIFVTGLPRSGTTLVEQIISSHSQVEGGGELGELTKQAQRLLIRKDGVAALRNLPDDTVAALGRSFADYLDERFPGAAHVTDKSIQSYMYIGLFKLALPNSRIIVVRRDPRDNLYSMYKNRFPESTHLYTYDQRDLVTFYGTFLDIVDFWRERVPDWFYEIQYEDLVANPEEESRKLIAACGLEWEDACLNFHENKRKVETLSVFQVRQPISKASVKGWQRYEKDLKPMLDALREGGYVTD